MTTITTLLITQLVFLSTFSRCLNITSTEEDDADRKYPEDRLLDSILDEDSYDRRVRPLIFDDNRKVVPLLVNVTFGLYTFIDMDEVKETGSAFVFVWEDWWDPRLAWDPAEYGGVDLVTLHVDNLWIPDVFLYELTTGQNDDKGQKTHLRVKTVRQDDKYNAQVTLPYGALLIERCPMQMMYYPFDRQVCRFCIGAMASTNSQIIFNTSPHVHDRHRATIGGEWILVNAVGVDVIYREFSISCVDVTVQRRSAFFGVNLFFPTIMVCLLNTIGLFSRLEESHTQVDIAVVGQTTLLNLGIIMLTVAADETPKGAAISILGVFFVIMIAQSLIASISAVYLRHRMNFRKRRALREARRRAKRNEKIMQQLWKVANMLPDCRSEVLEVAKDIPSLNEHCFNMINQAHVGNAAQKFNQTLLGQKPTIIRWEKVCMWVHIGFITIVAVSLVIIGMTLSPPTPEWQSPF